MFSEKAQSTVDLATDHAYACGLTEVPISSLLAALANDPESRIICAEYFGMAADKFQAACPKIQDAVPGSGQMPLAQAVLTVFDSAKTLLAEVPDPVRPGLIGLPHLAGSLAMSGDACRYLKVKALTREETLSRLASIYTAVSDAPNLVELTERLRALEAELLQKIYGQDHAVRAFIAALFNAELVAAADSQRKAPRAVFVFAGPPGVGKTYLSELGSSRLGRVYKRYDMSSYADGLAHMALVGTSRNFHGARPGVLTEFVDRNPNAVLLFDEVEKAHLNTIHLFLQVLDAGMLEDKYHERSIPFRDTTIIFTTNAGRQLYERPNTSGINASNAAYHRQTVLDALRSEVDPATDQPLFPAAICSRMATGYPVMFNHLKVNELERVVRAEVMRVGSLIQRQYLKQVFFDESVAMCLVLREGGGSDARALRAQAESWIKTELFRFCQLLKAASLEEVFQTVDQIRYVLDQKPEHADPEVRVLFQSLEPPRVLMVADPELSALYSENIPQIDWRTAQDEIETLRVVSEEDIDFVLLDLFLGNAREMAGGTLQNFDHLPAASKALQVGQAVLHKLRERLPDLPVFLLALEESDQKETGSSTVEEELFGACIHAGGARGVVGSQFIDGFVPGWQEERDKLGRLLSGMARQLHREREAARLQQQSKVLSFDTAPQIDHEKREVVIRLRNFRLTRAARAGDSGKLVEEAARPQTRFEDVIGAEGAKEDLKFFVEYLKKPRRYAALGLKPPKGVLLHGPPGTGKTMLARAMAGESNVAFLSSAGSRFVTKFQGSGPEGIRELFDRARSYAPAIVFIDEIDAIGKARGSGSAHGEEMALNELLTQMDGFEGPSRDRPVFVLAATNFRVDTGGSGSGISLGLDEALVRRFARTILVDLPDTAARSRYLTQEVQKVKSAAVSDLGLERVAEKTAGMSIANLEGVIDLAKRTALKEERPFDDTLLLESLDAARGRSEMLDSVERPKVGFDDVLGATKAKEELRFFIDYLKQPGEFAATGLKPPKGVLLHGPPGTGKTLLARAMAGESGLPFMAKSATDFQGSHAGEAEERIRDLFQRARRYAPAIIFIDEIDSIGKTRTGSWTDNVLNTLLTEMDGFGGGSVEQLVFVMAATNFNVVEEASESPDGTKRNLDPALVRRFTRSILVDLPGTLARGSYFERQMAAIPKAEVSEGVVKRLAEKSAGMSIANLEGVIELAKRTALKDNRPLDDTLLLESLDAARGRSEMMDSVERPKVSFGDVIGATLAKEELREFIDLLKDPLELAAYGLKPPKGVLLHGPPGTGKTMLARAMAGEAGVPFVAASASDFVTVWQGSGPQNLRNLFAKARRYAPTILFIDEIDVIGQVRVGAAGGARGEESTLNALLTELDGFGTPSPERAVFLLAATNADVEDHDQRDRNGGFKLDPALVRRFARKIRIGFPDALARRQFVSMQLDKIPRATVSDSAISTLVDRSVGRSISYLDDIFETAKRMARRQKAELNDGILIEALDLTAYGEVKPWSRDTLERVARHEVGHALMYWLAGWMPVELTVVARANFGGYLMHDPIEASRPLMSRDDILANIRTSLGGRAAELICYGRDAGLTTGAQGDLDSATEEARKMICCYGMDETFGLAVMPELLRNQQALSSPIYQQLNAAVRRILDREMDVTIKALEACRDLFDKLVGELMEKNTLYRRDLQQILPRSRKSIAEIVKEIGTQQGAPPSATRATLPKDPTG